MGSTVVATPPVFGSSPGAPSPVVTPPLADGFFQVGNHAFGTAIFSGGQKLTLLTTSPNEEIILACQNAIESARNPAQRDSAITSIIDIGIALNAARKDEAASIVARSLMVLARELPIIEGQPYNPVAAKISTLLQSMNKAKQNTETMPLQPGTPIAPTPTNNSAFSFGIYVVQLMLRWVDVSQQDLADLNHPLVHAENPTSKAHNEFLASTGLQIAVSEAVFMRVVNATKHDNDRAALIPFLKGLHALFVERQRTQEYFPLSIELHAHSDRAHIQKGLVKIIEYLIEGPSVIGDNMKKGADLGVTEKYVKEIATCLEMLRQLGVFNKKMCSVALQVMEQIYATAVTRAAAINLKLLPGAHRVSPEPTIKASLEHSLAKEYLDAARDSGQLGFGDLGETWMTRTLRFPRGLANWLQNLFIRREVNAALVGLPPRINNLH